MTKPKTTTSNDGLYNVSREHYQDSVDFYVGNKITVKDKKEKEEDPEVEKQSPDGPAPEDIDGLEALILGFNAPAITFTFDEEIAGQESLSDRAKQLSEKLWAFIVEIAKWIGELFTNKLARIEMKTRYTAQKRKINGIKSTPVKFYWNITSLIVPATITSNPVWVVNSAQKVLAFYLQIIDAHQYLKSMAREAPTTLDEFKQKQTMILNKIGRDITKNTIEGGVYQSDILPGCKQFNIQSSTSVHSDAVLTYFTDSAVRGRLVAKTWTPTPALIDENVKVLEKLVDTVRRNQRTTTTLIQQLANEVRAASRKAGLNSIGRNYFIWLTNLHKRLASTTINYVITAIDALNSFIYSGVR